MGALVTAAEVIRDETTPGANTATRVGQSMVNQAQAIEDSGQTKVYSAIIDASTDPPGVQEIFNGLGESVVFTIAANAVRATAENEFNPLKTFISFGSAITEDQDGEFLFPRTSFSISGQAIFEFLSITGTVLLPNATPFPVKIEIYP